MPKFNTREETIGFWSFIVFVSVLMGIIFYIWGKAI